MSLTEDLEWAVEDVRARLPRYTLYRDYDEGRQRLLFASAKYRDTFGDLFREFSDNLCDDVLDGITDRLQIVSWSAQDAGLNRVVDALWDRNQGESRTGAIHRNGFREGDGFAIVQQDRNQRARFYRQQPTQMAVRYSTENPDEKELAAKVWKVGKRWRLNLYYPDATMKFASRGTGADGGLPRAAAFKALQPGDPALNGADDAVIPHDDGIPVFHFPNGDLSEYGRSLLRGVIPLQDALNKAVADMLVTMEGHAAPLRWGIGLEVERDPMTGQEIDPFKRDGKGPGSILRTGSKDARFGQFDPSDMSGFLDVQDWFKIEIARKGALPPYSVTLRGGNSGTAPSGVALLVAEGRTVKLALDRQRDWGTEHRGMMAAAASLDMGTVVTAGDVDAEWAPPETRDMKSLLETLLLKKELKVPQRQLLLEAGYGSDEVDEWLADAADQEQTEATVLSVLAGGRQSVTPEAARAVSGNLGLPPGPVPPNGG